ncbi:hypothetical protein CHS0354_030135 [Potamilus streckersoni]|uniref:Uncharacterized protein n=1 Tax=Potamilus streckersoni TaxID=2493646 RepID=A0AAE0SU33_9BIVA|nr:hypothetical protein CHS0354_030135 [Potamilus streckersoni]
MSKILQSPNVTAETMRKEISAEFRDHGFNSANPDARERAERLEVEVSWPEMRQRRTARQFEYEGREQTQSSVEELVQREFFFLPLQIESLSY